VYPALSRASYARAVNSWVFDLIRGINLAVLLVSLGLEIWAFVHCAMQRADAFQAAETLKKGIWLALIGGTMLGSLLLWLVGVQFAMIAVIAALVYLLDIRARIRDVTSGGGRW
jgi:hypothetical protein